MSKREILDLLYLKKISKREVELKYPLYNVDSVVNKAKERLQILIR